jgi:hypothetical protein
VAVNALECGMSAKQREAVLMRLDFLRVQIPSVHRVALLAPRAKLAAVNVGVAIGAFHTDVLEIHTDMALRACNSGVHSAKRIRRLIVTKFRDAADGFPTGGSVAIFAGNVDRAVGIARKSLSLLRHCGLRRHRQ